MANLVENARSIFKTVWGWRVWSLPFLLTQKEYQYSIILNAQRLTLDIGMPFFLLFIFLRTFWEKISNIADLKNQVMFILFSILKTSHYSSCAMKPNDLKWERHPWSEYFKTNKYNHNNLKTVRTVITPWSLWDPSFPEGHFKWLCAYNSELG